MAYEIITQPESQIDENKAARDLSFITSCQVFSSSHNWRTVVYGGYGLDIFLGKLTRNHQDVDLVIYGQTRRPAAARQIGQYLHASLPQPKLSLEEGQFSLTIDANAPGMGANIYFVQTLHDPYLDIHTILKLNGEPTINRVDRYPPPVAGRLGDLAIEVQDPHLHLADILFKRRTQPVRPVHHQDIQNLKQITDPQIVQIILDKY